MSEPRRKSTVREIFSQNLQSKARSNVGKLRGRYLFRAAVRRVIEYKEWISEEIFGEQMGTDVSATVKLAQRKRSAEENQLTIKDRSILFIKPDRRSKEEIAYIEELLRDINAFKKYPEDVIESISADISYQYVPEGRTIIRQGHKPFLLYYIVNGQLQIFRDVTDHITGEINHIDVGLLQAGDMFGEIAMLHKVNRTATVVSKTAVDLLLVSRNAFDTHLKIVLLEEWDTLRDALVNFNYFKGWNEETMRECCILSKTLNYKPNEILLGDGKGMVHYVYFILSGECRLIEHMLIEKKLVGQKIKYKLYDSTQEDGNPRQIIGRSKKIDILKDNLSTMMTMPPTANPSRRPSAGNIELKDHRGTSAEDYIKLIASKKTNTNIVMDRISVVTVTLQDVLNQWHEITDTVEMLMKQPSVTTLQNYPENVQTVFMQICMFYRGACFGLGEQMRNRRIVSITPTKCLLIPRFWLTEHNRANIWERVKYFMNTKYPTNKQLFKHFVENRKWAKYKQEYAQNIVKNGRNIPNDTKMYDVPYSIRINENILDD